MFQKFIRLGRATFGGGNREKLSNRIAIYNKLNHILYDIIYKYNISIGRREESIIIYQWYFIKYIKTAIYFNNNNLI